MEPSYVYDDKNIFCMLEFLELYEQQEGKNDLFKMAFFIKNGISVYEKKLLEKNFIELLVKAPKEEVVKLVNMLKSSNNLSPKLVAIFIKKYPELFVEHSPLITDKQLAKLIDDGYGVYISKRKNLSEEIVNSLISEREPSKELLKNKHLHSKFIKLIALKHQQDTEILEMILSHKKELISIVDELPYKISKMFYEKINDRQSNDSNKYNQDVKHIDYLWENNMLTNNIIVQYLCQGKVEFFAYCLSKLSDISEMYINNIALYDSKEFMYICRISGFSKQEGKAVRVIATKILEHKMFSTKIDMLKIKKELEFLEYKNQTFKYYLSMIKSD